MLQKTYNIELNILTKTANQVPYIPQYEYNVSKFIFTIYNNGDKLDLTNAIINTQFKKPDKNVIVKPVTITNATSGICEIMVDQNMTAVAGEVRCELEIIIDNKKTYTSEFTYRVDSAVVGDIDGIKSRIYTKSK